MAFVLKLLLSAIIPAAYILISIKIHNRCDSKECKEKEISLGTFVLRLISIFAPLFFMFPFAIMDASYLLDGVLFWAAYIVGFGQYVDGSRKLAMGTFGLGILLLILHCIVVELWGMDIWMVVTLLIVILFFTICLCYELFMNDEPE